MRITVKIDDTALKTAIDNMQKKDIPFAIARALTWTAKDAQTDVKNEMQKVFDKPTRYTLNSTYVIPAKKDNLQAIVGMKDQASGSVPAFRYLKAEMDGGPRKDKSSEKKVKRGGMVNAFEQSIPGEAMGIDQYGNMRSSQRKMVYAAIGNGGKSTGKRAFSFFIGRPGGGKLPLGIWQRTKDGVRPWVIFVSSARYRKKLDYEGIVARSVQRTFDDNFEKSFMKIMSDNKDFFWGS